MNAMRTSLVISESGRMSLASAGITIGWLTAWLQSAGTGQVSVHAFEEEHWKADREGWFVIIADEADLMRAALQQGQRIGVEGNGRRKILGAESLHLENPERMAWLYRHGVYGSRTLLLSPGDMAYNRETWLHLLNDGRAFVPLQICLEAACSSGVMLEPGLCARLGDQRPLDSGFMLNDGGYLPEEQVLHLLHDRGVKLRLAESCTGGGISARLTRVPGASQVLDRSWVTYSNEAKQQELGVPGSLIDERGAVSREVVEGMASGGSDSHHACIAVSGVAGPDGGSPDKPVGTVWIAVDWPGERTLSARFMFEGSRTEIQARAVVSAMAMLSGVALGNWPRGGRAPCTISAGNDPSNPV